MKKRNIVWPQYVKNPKGKTTHVYLPIEAYEALSKELKGYEKIKKEKGVRWVRISQEQHIADETKKKKTSKVR